MRAEELLFERYINLFTNADKMQYGQEVWDLLQKAYADKGGFKSAPDIEIPSAPTTLNAITSLI